MSTKYSRHHLHVLKNTQNLCPYNTQIPYAKLHKNTTIANAGMDWSINQNIEIHKKDDIAVLIPCLNEEKTIGKVITDFQKALPDAHIYVYDNGSDDNTAAIADIYNATVRYVPAQGKANVIRAMLHDIDAHIYIMVDGDDTYPAEAAQSLILPIQNGTADHVIGDRLSRGQFKKTHSAPFHGIGNKLVRWLVNHIWHTNYADIMSGYQAFSRSAAKSLLISSDGFQLETEIAIFAACNEWTTVCVPIEYRDRPKGSSSKISTIKDGCKIIFFIIQKALQPKKQHIRP